MLARGDLGKDASITPVYVDLGGDQVGANVQPILNHGRCRLVTRGFNRQNSGHCLYTFASFNIYVEQTHDLRAPIVPRTNWGSKCCPPG